MNIICFGSINIDHVYQVDHLVRPGETLVCDSYQTFAGGKGFNQSVALARAGASIKHAGKIGPDGLWLKRYLERLGVDTSMIFQAEEPTGHGLIQVDRQGQNSIVVYSGANKLLTQAEIDLVLSSMQPHDILLLQNEINGLPGIIERASMEGIRIAMNPAPMDSDARKLPLSKIEFLIVNEVEAATLAQESSDDQVLQKLMSEFPDTKIVLTKGNRGVSYGYRSQVINLPAWQVRAVDTTGAGDTFTGYFLAEISMGYSAEIALQVANKAASVCVTRKGAADSIPYRADVG